MNDVYLKELDRFVAEGRASEEGRAGQWRLERGRCGARDSALLYSPPGERPRELVFSPPGPGVYDVYVGCWGYTRDDLGLDHQIGIYARLASQPYSTFLITEVTEAGFYEHFFCRADLTNDQVVLDSFDQETWLDYIRFVPVPADQWARWRAGRAKPPAYEVCGICDVPDEAWLSMPDGLEAASCVWRHQQAGFTKIYWRACAVQCEYWTKAGEVRGITVADEHLGTTQQARKGKTVDGLLKQYDVLRQAVEEAKRCGISIYGWMRINNEFSRQNRQFSAATRFHREHPDCFQLYKNGDPSPRLSFSSPDVRQWKTALALEIAEYGVNGILIDCLRHPPMVQYDPPVVEAFKQQYGEDPLAMPGDGSPEWLRFRAGFFTLFLREVRQALRARFGDRVKLGVRCHRWLWKCLRDGMDVPTWIDEDLVDELVVSPHCNSGTGFPLDIDIRPFLELRTDTVKMNAVVWRYSSIDTAEILARDLAVQGADGFAFYESNWLLHHATQRERIRRFRGLE